ncbi:MAG TPA: glucose 1-dehydrogenase [Thermomicrobiales bacterium]|nr:glucose 1-dehydrogenase [Thermomicrobiales bacterium]
MEFPSMRVDGKVAVITGTGTGIGQATALALAQAGAHVVVTELPDRLAAAEATAQTARESGVEAQAVPLDVTSLASIDGMVRQALARFGRIDILVNNAGVNIPKYAVDVTEADWDTIFAIDLKGLFFTSQAVGKEMIKRESGKIINIASQMGVVGYFKRAPYGAAKAGVVNLTRVLAIEWAPYGVRVNAVAPTFLETPLTAPMFAEEGYYQEIVGRIPLGYIGKPQDVVGAVVYLASPAADLVTGHALLVDGGWTAW